MRNYLLNKLALGSKAVRIQYLLHKIADYSPELLNYIKEDAAKVLEGEDLKAAQETVQKTVREHFLQRGIANADKAAKEYAENAHYYITPEGVMHAPLGRVSLRHPVVQKVEAALRGLPKDELEQAANEAKKSAFKKITPKAGEYVRPAPGIGNQSIEEAATEAKNTNLNETPVEEKPKTEAPKSNTRKVRRRSSGGGSGRGGRTVKKPEKTGFDWTIPALGVAGAGAGVTASHLLFGGNKNQ